MLGCAGSFAKSPASSTCQSLPVLLHAVMFVATTMPLRSVSGLHAGCLLATFGDGRFDSSAELRETVAAGLPAGECYWQLPVACTQAAQGCH